MKKRTLVAMMLVLLLVLLSACAEEESPFWGCMHRYPVNHGCNVFVDNLTGVCYFQYSTGGITVMLDANGKPLIYKGE